MKKKVLFLFADGVEELELIAPVDVLRRAGVEVVMANVGEGIHVQ
ncbi:MAG: DJ-1/PfpI family protein, partial [Verrucomicrobia bacterium]|nr:DJ-1/PfpI family protein [Verrucomicrobiota bacterium]